MFFGFFEFFFFISVQSCFLFQIHHVVTVHRQTISPRWAASWRLQTREEEKSWYISSGYALLTALCAPFLRIGADGNWISHEPHQWVRKSTTATFARFCSGLTLLCFISEDLVEDFELFKAVVGPHFGCPKQIDSRSKLTAWILQFLTGWASHDLLTLDRYRDNEEDSDKDWIKHINIHKNLWF